MRRCVDSKEHDGCLHAVQGQRDLSETATRYHVCAEVGTTCSFQNGKLLILFQVTPKVSLQK